MMQIKDEIFLILGLFFLQYNKKISALNIYECANMTNKWIKHIEVLKAIDKIVVFKIGSS